jgi:hypothetical protein
LNLQWGSRRQSQVHRHVKTAGIAAWVASIPKDKGDGGGDLHFMPVCSHDLISRVALADVSGHGREVDAAAMTLHKLMRENIGVWEQSDFMPSRPSRNSLLLAGAAG